MEQYSIVSDNAVSCVYGDYAKHIYDLYKKEYDESAATKIKQTATKILNETFNKIDMDNNNVLLVGKVQSGKTSNLEMITGLAFDSGYNLLIIYGGYDNTLLQQTVDRFTASFDMDDEDKTPYIYSTLNSNDMESLDENEFESILNENKPVIVASIKRPDGLNSVNGFLERIKKLNVKGFIIDDEGDQASLNTNGKGKGDSEYQKDASATYDAICRMKELMNDPFYFAVTATPEANIFQSRFSKIMPSSIKLIPPGNGYTGADFFHLQEENIEVIDNDEGDENEKITKSLRDAINYFILGSVLLRKRNINASDMIVHSYREVASHQILYIMIDSLITDMKECYKKDPTSWKEYLDDFKDVFDRYDLQKKGLEWDETTIDEDIYKVISSLKVFQQNSKNSITKNERKIKRARIWIGGDLLQRGLTFKYLICTYFTRSPKEGNIDTTLQRCRWFGYRSKYLDICKVFTIKKLKKEFAQLAATENDLWDQFQQVCDKQLNIDDIIVDAGDTNLKPTRSNVADYKSIKFSSKWSNQRCVSFDSNVINHNNAVVETLINSLNFHPTTAGLTEKGIAAGKTSARVAEITRDQLTQMINEIQDIFDFPPFISPNNILKNVKEEKISLELMFEKIEDIRYRSVDDDGYISALQQGANNADDDKKIYMGDAYVIDDPNAISIQIYNMNLLNYLDKTKKGDEFRQYMFSFHFPTTRKGFIKKG